ncbi:FAD-dependent oxidoreductase [Paraferrimonas sp. SM1919]|uniref:FAD-dependent oxidoreductase n=1 Tax=Paraferrimonas sp. SM1919 TaxID=2662263 RepID=UPI0013D1E453|nr:FAD-dependent oxidoreductase [Paraferrimonas sp. SM1919]
MADYLVWECQVCNWIYDEAKGCPEEGLAAGTRWADIADDWLCPECGVGKQDFEMIAIAKSTVVEATAPLAAVSSIRQTPYQVWECQVCNWIYDEAKGCPEEGLAPGTRWADIPDDWLCPECGVGKEDFDMIAISESQPHNPTTTEAVASDSIDNDSAAWQSNDIVIIGSGLAGYNLVKKLRALDCNRKITVITADDGSFYSKPALSTGFAKNKTAQDLATSNAETMAASLNIDLYVFTKVCSIDKACQQLVLADGGLIDYQQLVLATGANPIDAGLDKSFNSHIFQINDLADYAKFRVKAATANKIMIVGAGLIGSEYANDLLQAGFNVEMVDPMAGPLASLLPEIAQSALASALQAAGATTHFGTLIKNIEKGSQHPLKLTMNNGSSTEVDLVLSAIGVRPNLALANAAGLSTNRGICVNGQLQTSDNHIYAIGDCAEVNGEVRFYLAPMNAQIATLAATLAGQASDDVNYGVMPVQVKTSLHPVSVVPAIGLNGQWQTTAQNETGVVCEFIDDHGQLRGFAATGSLVKQGQELARRCIA